MRAEIIAIGDEITTGQRLDTNTQWLAERLTELGVDVAFHSTIGDSLEDNVAVFKAAIDRVDVVVAHRRPRTDGRRSHARGDRRGDGRRSGRRASLEYIRNSSTSRYGRCPNGTPCRPIPHGAGRFRTSMARRRRGDADRT